MTWFVEDADGFKTGKHPSDMTPEEFASAGHVAKPVMAAIKEKCLDCSGGVRSEVMKCTSIKCALWPFRAGHNPFRTARVMSDEQKAAAVERLRKSRESRQ